MIRHNPRTDELRPRQSLEVPASDHFLQEQCEAPAERH